jgi:hypothetical protein
MRSQSHATRFPANFGMADQPGAIFPTREGRPVSLLSRNSVNPTTPKTHFHSGSRTVSPILVIDDNVGRRSITNAVDFDHARLRRQENARSCSN